MKISKLIHFLKTHGAVHGFFENRVLAKTGPKKGPSGTQRIERKERAKNDSIKKREKAGNEVNKGLEIKNLDDQGTAKIWSEVSDMDINDYIKKNEKDLSEQYDKFFTVDENVEELKSIYTAIGGKEDISKLNGSDLRQKVYEKFSEVRADIGREMVNKRGKKSKPKPTDKPKKDSKPIDTTTDKTPDSGSDSSSDSGSDSTPEADSLTSPEDSADEPPHRKSGSTSPISRRLPDSATTTDTESDEAAKISPKAPDKIISISKANKKLKEVGTEISGLETIKESQIKIIQSRAYKQQLMFSKLKLIPEIEQGFEDTNYYFQETIDKNIIIKFTPLISQETFEWSAKNGFGDKNALTKKIHKIMQAYLTNEAFKKYEKRNRIKKSLKKIDHINNKKYLRYLKDWKVLAKHKFTSDPKIADKKDKWDLQKDWDKFNGTAKVEYVMGKYPFNINKEAVRNKVGDIFEYNTFVNLKTLFKSMENLPKDANDFLEQYEKLDENAVTLEEMKQLEAMRKILFPCFELMESINALKQFEGSENEKDLSPEELIYADLAPGQEQTVNALKRLFGFNKNKEPAIVMGDITGANSLDYVERYKRNVTPLAGILDIINEPGLTTWDKNDKRVFNQDALMKKINEILKSGYKQLSFEGENIKWAKEPTHISGIETIGEQDLVAFRVGYMKEQNKKYTEHYEKGIEYLSEKNPKIKELIDAIKAEMKKNNKELTQGEINRITSQLLFTGYLTAHNDEVTSFGLLVPITINKNLTVLVGAGGNLTGQGSPLSVHAGIALKIVDTKTFDVDLNAFISTQGAGVGATAEWEPSPGLKFFIAPGFGVIPASATKIGAVLRAGIDATGAMYQDNLAEEKARVKEQSGLKAIWNTWIENGSNMSTDEKWKLIKKMPNYQELKNKMETSGGRATKADIVEGIDMYIEKLQEKAFKDTDVAPIVGFELGGFAVVTAATGGNFIAGILGGLKFNIGSSMYFIPSRKEEDKLIERYENTKLEESLRASIDKIKTGQTRKGYFEKLPTMVYTKDKGMGLLLPEEHYKLSEFGNSLDSYNKGLKNAEVRLEPLNDGTGRHKLIVLGDKDKVIRAYGDPVDKTGGMEEGKEIIVDGAIHNLIISRNRITFPHLLHKNEPNIVDEIVIRFSDPEEVDSITDTKRIKDTSPFYLERTPGSQTYREKRGINEQEKRKDAKEHVKHRPNMVTKEMPKTWSENYKNTIEALNARKASEYSAEKPRDMFEQKLRIAFKFRDGKKQLAFQKEFTKPSVLSDPDKMEEVINKYLQKNAYEPIQNDKEKNIAISFMLTEWYTTLYKKDKMEGKSLQKANEMLARRLENLKRFTQKVFQNQFEELNLERLGITSTAESMAKRLADDAYGKLQTLLRNKPPRPEGPIDFIDLKVDPFKPGEYVAIATRAKEKDKTHKLLSKFVNYEKPEKQEGLVHDFGLLKATVTPYDIESMEIDSKTKTPLERDLAKALWEIASPMPEEYEKLIDSPLTQKIVGTQAYQIMVYEKDGGGDAQAKKMIEIIKKPSILRTDSEARTAMERFSKLIQRIRTSQLTGETLVIDTKFGYRVEISINKPEIRGGLFAKCGNLSSGVTEMGYINVFEPVSNTRSTMVHQKRVLNTKLSKKFHNIGLTGAYSQKTVSNKDGKDINQGTEETEVTDGKSTSDKATPVGSETVDPTTYEAKEKR